MNQTPHHERQSRPTLIPEILKELEGASEARNADSLAEAAQTEAGWEDPDLKVVARHHRRQLVKSIIVTEHHRYPIDFNHIRSGGVSH